MPKSEFEIRVVVDLDGDDYTVIAAMNVYASLKAELNRLKSDKQIIDFDIRGITNDKQS